MKIKFLLLWLLFSSLSYAKTYSILQSPPTLEPIHFIDENGKATGFEVEFLNEIEKRSGIHLERTVSSNFSQAMQEVK